MQLTPSQHRVLNAIREYLGENGYSPTLGELGGMLGVDKGTIHGHVVRLEEKGAVIRDKHKSRNIMLCPTFEERFHKLRHMLRRLAEEFSVVESEVLEALLEERFEEIDEALFRAPGAGEAGDG